MNEIKYSIITPNYNSFHLMKNYFESLENQTYKNFEVIIIDDASTDDSYNELLNYKEKSKLNLKILKNEKNSGPGTARNYGMREAVGTWITFIDNDDKVDEELLEKIDNVLKHNDVDCVVYDYYIEKKEKTTVGRSMYDSNEGIISVSNAISYLRNHAVCKFYKIDKCREFNISFPNIRRHEDVAFVAKAVSCCNKIYYLKEPLYYYVQRGGSLSNSKNLDEKVLINAFGILEKDLLEKYPKEIAEKSVPDLLYGSCLIMCKLGRSREQIRKFIDEYEKKYPFWENAKIISYLGLSKRIFLLAIKHRCVFIMKFMANIHARIIG